MSGSRIDVHHHYLPAFYREALVAAGLSKPDGIAALPEWSAASALEAMDRLGIQKAYLSISSPGVHFGDAAAARSLARRVNESGEWLKRTHPDRFGFFASVPLPDVPGALEEVRHAFDHLGADGVVLLTHFQGLYPGHASLAPFYEELDRRQAVVFLHPTTPHCACQPLAYPQPMLEFIFDTTRSVTDLLLSGTLERYPNLRLLVPHAGAALPILADRIQLVLNPALTPPGVVASRVPIREALRRLHYDLAGAPVPELLGALQQVADPGRIHYGSDWPFTPTDACEALAAKLDSSPLLAGGLGDRVMRENTLQLFSAATEATRLKQTLLSRIVAHFAAVPEQVGQQFDAVHAKLITPDTESSFRSLRQQRISAAGQVAERVRTLARKPPQGTVWIDFASLVRYRRHDTDEERQGIFLGFCPDNFPVPLEDVGQDLLPDEFRHHRVGDTFTIRFRDDSREETYTILQVR